LLSNGTIQVLGPNSNREVYFTSNENADRYHVYSADDVYSPKRSEYGDTFTSPQLRERLSNEAEYIIITHDDFARGGQQACRTPSYTYAGLKSSVLTLSEIYDDFSVGNIDIMAIRNAIRYAYLNNSDDNKPKYVCLFGDTSYDYKDRVPNNNMIVPTYHALNSFHLANSYMSDDFYTMMDDDEGDLSFYRSYGSGCWSNPVSTPRRVLSRWSKQVHRLQFGTMVTGKIHSRYLSDDPDEDWESYYSTDDLMPLVRGGRLYNKPFVNLNLQSCMQMLSSRSVSASGDRYPGVNSALGKSVYSGLRLQSIILVMVEKADSLLREYSLIKNLRIVLYNPGRFPLFVTSTCEFSRFDNPEVYTAGEASFANPAGGVIGLLSTTRQIYVDKWNITYNKIHCRAFIRL
jgi:hypothetical protein